MVTLIVMISLGQIKSVHSSHCIACCVTKEHRCTIEWAIKIDPNRTLSMPMANGRILSFKF